MIKNYIFRFRAKQFRFYNEGEFLKFYFLKTFILKRWKNIRPAPSRTEIERTHETLRVMRVFQKTKFPAKSRK